MHSMSKATRPLAPSTRRLVGLLLLLSGALMSLGLLLKVGIAVYSWSALGSDSPDATRLSLNLVGLLASGLLMRMGLRMRRRPTPSQEREANEIV